MGDTLPRHRSFLTCLCFVMALLSACERATTGADERQPSAPSTKAQHLGAEQFAREIVSLLSERRITALADRVHPEHGVLLSPYGYIDATSAITFKPQQLREAWRDNATQRWGFADGSGEPIDLPIHEFFASELYPLDFAIAPEVAVNRVVGRGNSVDNLATVFQQAEFVEFHFPGVDPEFNGMDWRSLRIVIEPTATGGGWWLVGLVIDRWTI